MQTHKESRPLALGLTVLSAMGRLLPHAPNMTPLGGSCLFAGSKVPGLPAYLLPLVVMIATDPFLGGYTWMSPVIYGCFLINVWMGRRLLSQVSPMRVGAVAFLCSLQFFALTNLATWISSVARHTGYYSSDLSGLIHCYALALPFWGRTLAGDLLFSAALFGMYELIARRTGPVDLVRLGAGNAS